MSNVLDTTLTFTNEIDLRGREIIRLLKLYIPGFKEVYYGHRPIGADEIVFPCAMVEPTMSKQTMYTTAKFDIRFTYDIYFYFLNNERDALVTLQTEASEAMIKMFSNNALDDLGVLPPSNKYKTNPGFWITSEMSPVRLSSTFSWSRDNRPQYCRAGVFELEVMDRVLK